jgi:4'-phosphopantetheinyl transferase
MDEHISLHYTAVPAQPWPALSEWWLPRLPPAKRSAIERLRQPADRNASLLGIALLARALEARARPLAPEALEFPPRGKPRLPAGPDFSIAHAGGYVGCALAAVGRVGFDIEPDGAVPAGLLERITGESAGPDPTSAWVRVEATLKAAGRGIEAARHVRLAASGASIDGAGFALERVALPAPLIGWVAHEGAMGCVRVVCHGARELAPLS